MAHRDELPICPFCKNSGVHMCPDVAEPVLVKCSHKACAIVSLSAEIEEQDRFIELLNMKCPPYDEIANRLEKERAINRMLTADLDWIQKGPTWGPGAPTLEHQADMQSKRAREALIKQEEMRK